MRINIQINNVPEIFGRGGGGRGFAILEDVAGKKHLCSKDDFCSVPSPPPHKQIPKLSTTGEAEGCGWLNPSPKPTLCLGLKYV